MIEIDGIQVADGPSWHSWGIELEAVIDPGYYGVVRQYEEGHATYKQTYFYHPEDAKVTAKILANQALAVKVNRTLR